MRDKYGRTNAKNIKKLEKIAKLVEQKEAFYLAMSDSELAAQTDVLRGRFDAGETLDQLLPDAFAVCREASKRVLGQRHYHVQILGGIALHQGRICQMATGEGKTLTETLPAYLNALTRQGVHIITVNEYLAQRDMEWMGKVFRFLGLTVGVTLSNMKHADKKRAYNCDITYGTNSEFGFDYLRDNMALQKDQRVQRPLNFVIIDEVDSILIDEARTPLIISGPGDKSSEDYQVANRFVCTLTRSTNVDEEGKTASKEVEPNGDYVVDNKDKTVRLTERGISKAERFYKITNLSSPDSFEINHYINCALRAHALMRRDEDYIVEKGQVVIVDTFTGRKLQGRRFSNGLHQAIEAKERVTIQKESKTFATITFQNLFRLYRKLSGMTGTAKTEEDEFNKTYNIDVVCIPTNKPVIRDDQNDRIYRTREGKLRAIVNEIATRNKLGQPVLVGTTTVEKSEELSKLLTQARIQHNVLNAKQHKREAEIISQAGTLGHVTIATNMAGRGTDILLGGNPELLAKTEMKRLGYTDEQIEASTSLAQGDLETEQLKQVFADLVAKHKVATDEERQQVLALGGLCVIGTELHESRRIDNQLRGRAGRQGDPGTSIFFISTEDEMIRVFGGEMMGRVMAFVNFDEDTAIQSKMLTRMIASCQKRLEGMHFSSRKNVLQFDDVNNQQRKAIYKERDRLLNGEDVHADILQMAEEYARYALENACEGNEDSSEWDIDKVNANLFKYFVTEKPLLDAQNVGTAREVLDYLAQYCRDTLDTRYKEEPLFVELERVILLQNIDKLWMDHIDALDEVRKGVGLQSIGQHDPLMVYKKEAFEMFEDLNKQIKMRTIGTLLFARIKITGPSQPTEQQSDINPNKSKNKPCPCGSGKKYKDCCYQRDLAAQQAQEQLQQEQPSEDQQPTVLTNKERWALAREERRKNKKK